MAKLNSTTIPSDEERTGLAFEASWEIEVLARHLLENAASEKWNLDHDHAMILRCLGTRIKSLAEIITGALDCPIPGGTNGFASTVFGCDDRAASVTEGA